ncbi:MAG TPA: cytochrome P450 [Thermoleophilaceae bacterium]|nr:cytochrome P450 [Thermoleophilaceae bacterium]
MPPISDAAVYDGLPPGPPLGALTHTARWVARPISLMERARRRYGDLFTLRLLDHDVVFVADPALVKQVFTTSAELLHAGEGNDILLPLVGSRSLLLLDEDEHLRERRLLLPSFHGERIRAYESVMAAAADRAVERWPLERPFALQPQMARLTLEVIVRAVFGIHERESHEEVAEAVRALLEPNMPALLFFPALRRDLGPHSPWGRFLADRARVDRLLYGEIARRREADLDGREDVLSTLIEARREDGEALSDRELRDELMTLLVAGHETTATALAWTFELLFRHPAALERLEAAVAAGDDAYPDAVVHEALRLRPVVPIVMRRLTAPMTLGRWRLAAGTVVAPCVYLLHRRAEIYPSPLPFAPSASSTPPPAPIPSCPSAAGCGAVWGRALRCLSCARYSPEWWCGPGSDPPRSAPSGWRDEASPWRRAVGRWRCCESARRTGARGGLSDQLSRRVTPPRPGAGGGLSRVESTARRADPDPTPQGRAARRSLAETELLVDELLCFPVCSAR